jgi:hypothetical protein
VNALPETLSEPTKLDTSASDSFTRSGTFALLLTVILSLLIPYWIERRNEMALGAYIAYRANLANQIETLDENPVWKEYKASNKDAELMSIGQLLKASLASLKPAPEIKTQKKVGTAAKPTAPPIDPNHPRPPTPPTGLSVSVAPAKLEAVIPIADSLGLLNDSDLLTRSREVSNFFEFSIVRWANKRSNLMYENISSTNCFTKESWEIPSNHQGSEHFVPALEKDALLNCLTLRDVRELAQLELPTFSNPVQAEGRIQREVQVSPSSFLPRDLYMASILV